jgi:hypothetical protein
MEAWQKVVEITSSKLIDEEALNQNAPVTDEQKKDIIKNLNCNYVLPYIEGSFAAGYFGMYTYMQEVLSVTLTEEVLEHYKWYESTLDIGLFYPLEDFCIISQKPIEIYMSDGLLHKDLGASVLYEDGFKVYSLWGIKVPEYLAMTPSANLDINFFLKENNADVKATFIRKYGMERMISYGNEIDCVSNYFNHNDKNIKRYFNSIYVIESDYKLYDMSKLFKSINYAPYLYMKNLTTGIYHMEGIEPSCKNLVEAINWREDTDISSVNVKEIK